MGEGLRAEPDILPTAVKYALITPDITIKGKLIAIRRIDGAVLTSPRKSVEIPSANRKNNAAMIHPRVMEVKRHFSAHLAASR